MKPRTVELFVPELGVTLNALMREVGWKIYKGMCGHVRKALLVAGAGRVKPFERPVEMHFTPRLGPKRRKYDVTNYVVVVKSIEDRLVECGVLRGDTSEYVRGIHLLCPELASDGIEGILVRIVEMDLAVVPQQSTLELPEHDELEEVEF